MNLILVDKSCVDLSTGQVILTGRQAEHVLRVLKPEINDPLKLGIKNGWKGVGHITHLISSSNKNVVAVGGNGHKISTMEVHINLPIEARSLDVLTRCDYPFDDGQPLPRIDVVVAMPRPKTFHKVLQYGASLAVRRMIFVCTSRVEKSYFSSPKLSKGAIHEALHLGLEQAGCTLFPDVIVYASWKTFINELHTTEMLSSDSLRLLAHPGTTDNVAIVGIQGHQGPVTVLLGPEGGLLDFEVKQLEDLGFRSFTLGERILRVEVAFCSVVSQIQLLSPNGLDGLRHGQSQCPSFKQFDDDSSLDVNRLVACDNTLLDDVDKTTSRIDIVNADQNNRVRESIIRLPIKGRKPQREKEFCANEFDKC